MQTATARPVAPPLDTHAARAAVSWRALSAVAVLLALATVLARGALAGHAPGHPAAVAPAHAASLPIAAQSSISAALGRDSHTYSITPSGSGFRALSDRQQLRAHFDRAGIRLQTGATRLALGLDAIGYGSAQQTLGAVDPAAAANRVTYSRAGLNEWYVNGPFGIEQGFTILHAPSVHPRGPLTLSMSLTGNARASLSADGQSMTFGNGASPALRYTGLAASDAAGRALHSWLSLAAGKLVLHVDSAGARYPLRIDPFYQTNEKLTPTGEQGPAKFGYSVAVSADGTTALIGGPRDNEFVGAAWVFTRIGSKWEQQGAKLTDGEPPASAESCDEEAGEEMECAFGGSVALSADGNTALIGAPSTNEGRGAAWVFTRSGGQWTRAGEPLTDGEQGPGPRHLGRSVALSGDGQTALVGAPASAHGQGAAWVFARSGSSWIRQSQSLSNGASGSGESHFGRSVALSSNGATAVIGAPGENEHEGGAWGFRRSGSTWSAREALAGSGKGAEARFGFSVALSGDGQTALVGARDYAEKQGAAWAFARGGSGWEQQGAKLTGNEESGNAKFGFSVALSSDGNVALIGGPLDGSGVGTAWVYTRSGSTWQQQGGKLQGALPNPPHEPDRAFGTSVALSADGQTALIGGPHEQLATGAVWAFQNTAAPAPPHVTSVTPTEGSVNGGTKVTIKGSGFLEGADVTIGSKVTSRKWISETEMTATTAPSALGEAEVVVTNENGGRSSGGPFFLYTAETKSKGGGGGTGGGGTPTGNENGNTQQPGFGLGPGAPALPLVQAPAKPAPAIVPPPTLGVSSDVRVISGTVLVKLPGSNRFVPLSGLSQVPFGAIIDARHGKVTITFALPHGGTQTMTLSEGEFKLSQSRTGAVTAALVGGDFSVCPTARERSHIARTASRRSSSKHVVRKLWAEGHAKFSTRGNYASGAVQGTRWLTEDLCGGTLYHVVTDKVLVTNLVNHHHVLVKAGHTYLAKAP